MFQKVLASFCLLFALPVAAVAQQPPPPTTSSAWMVHDENGPTNYKIAVSYCIPDFYLGYLYYRTLCTDTATGAVVAQGWLVAPMGGPYTILGAYSDDSEIWCSWVWRTDHYDKVGGSAAVRSYHPAR